MKSSSSAFLMNRSALTRCSLATWIDDDPSFLCGRRWMGRLARGLVALQCRSLMPIVVFWSAPLPSPPPCLLLGCSKHYFLRHLDDCAVTSLESESVPRRTPIVLPAVPCPLLRPPNFARFSRSMNYWSGLSSPPQGLSRTFSPPPSHSRLAFGVSIPWPVAR